MEVLLFALLTAAPYHQQTVQIRENEITDMREKIFSTESLLDLSTAKPYSLYLSKPNFDSHLTGLSKRLDGTLR